MHSYVSGATRRIFRVEGVTIDEALRDLQIDGRSYPIEAKPRALLLALLERPNETVGKRDLLTAAWGNPDIADDRSLTTAIAKLRSALGSRGHDIVRLARDEGYRLGCPVEVWTTSDRPRLLLGFEPGDPVPARPSWRFERPLTITRQVWTVLDTASATRLVVSFADTTDRAESLKRQAAASNKLRESLGERDDLAPILDCRFDTVPHFVSRRWAGVDLATFAAAGHLASMTEPARLRLFCEIARVIGRAHDVDVVHGAVGPGHILIDAGADKEVVVRVIGFAGEPVNPASDPYCAPERRAGAPASIGSDLYGLAILLFALWQGSLPAELPVGWADHVADPLIRQDLLEATARPLPRLASVAALVDRVERLDARRASARFERSRRTRTLAERRRRRRGAGIAACALALGGAAAAWIEHDVARQRSQRLDHLAQVTEVALSGLVTGPARITADEARLPLYTLQNVLDLVDTGLERMGALASADAGLKRLGAESLSQSARVEFERDDLPRALASARDAERALTRLVATRPADRELVEDLAGTERVQGDVMLRERDPVAALKAYGSMTTLLSQLSSRFPSDTALRRHWGRAEDAVGDALMAQARTTQALATYRHAWKLIAPAVATNDPAAQYDLSLADEKLSDALEASKDFHGSLQAGRDSLQIRRRLLSEDGGNNFLRHGLAVAEGDVGDELWYLNDFAGALTAYQAALADDEELVRQDPGQENWKRSVLVVYDDIASSKSMLADMPGAIAAELSANQISRSLAAHNPNDLDLGRDIVATEVNLASYLIKAGDRAQSVRHAHAALSLAKSMLRLRPADPEFVDAVRQSQALAGEGS